ncbi:hypothetical protein ACQKP0_25385 [Heyndrickxia sp. NPDC080065]|uniref:hypothetical protein n=1 Tax=Heyndrickxia sp. NPDC080065 TaxID=3390568 RepID=UPI003CFC0A1B
MKTVKQAIIISFIIHIIYFMSNFLSGYVKTKSYQPDWESAYKNVDNLQNEVTFGVATHPIFYLFTFIGITLFSGLILHLIKFRKTSTKN